MNLLQSERKDTTWGWSSWAGRRNRGWGGPGKRRCCRRWRKLLPHSQLLHSSSIESCQNIHFIYDQTTKLDLALHFSFFNSQWNTLSCIHVWCKGVGFQQCYVERKSLIFTFHLFLFWSFFCHQQIFLSSLVWRHPPVFGQFC